MLEKFSVVVMKKYINSLVVFVSAFSISDVSASNNDPLFSMTLEELSKVTVVTAASGFEQSVSRAPATVTVITDSQWQVMGARSLSDVLMMVPGVHVGEPQTQYKHKKFIARGLSGESSSQIKLLIDGEVVENFQDGGLLNGFYLPLTSFKRIEIVKGPGSAIYGADAFGGVINLVSYTPQEIKTSIGGRMGSFNTYDVYAKSGFSLGDVNVALSFEYTTSNDDKGRVIASDLQSTFDGVFGTQASNAPGVIDESYEVLFAHSKIDWNQWQLSYMRHQNYELGVAGGIGQALDPNAIANSRDEQFGVSYDFSEWVAGELTAAFYYKKQWNNSRLNVLPAGTVVPIGEDGNLDFVAPTTVTLFTDGYIGTPSSGGNNTAYRLTHLVNLGSAHYLRWEVGYEKLRFNASERKNFGPSVLNGTETVVDGTLTDVTGTPYIYLPNIDREFYYLSVQDEWQVTENVQLVLGARYDNYSDFGASTNPRLGLIWQATDALSLKMFAGTAINSPSIAQLYSQNNPVGVGNASLEPETVNTLETGLGLEYFVNENLIISASVYHYHAKDLVEFVFNESIQGSVAQNIGEQKGKGMELVVKWKPLRNVTIDANYAYIDAEDANGLVIPDIPKHLAYFGSNWQIDEQWNWSLGAKWVGKRERPLTDARAPLPNYTWVTSKLVRNNVINNVDVALIINNALDTDAREPSNGAIADDYPQPGRQILLEASYKF